MGMHSNALYLFDVFDLDDENSTADPKSYLDIIRHDLENLLNTRKHLIAKNKLYDNSIKKTFLNYGMQDISYINPNRNNEMKELSAQLKELISTYEQRLLHVEIQPVKNNGSIFETSFNISASVLINDKTVNVSYQSTVDWENNCFNLTGKSYD